MKVKETIYTEIDERGRITKRTRNIEIDETITDRGYDHATRHGDGNPHQGSISRIMEAYADYYKSLEW